MQIDELRDYCLAKRGVEEGLPFGPDTLVFKVLGKMFALSGLNNIDPSVNLKCNPERAVELRDRHSEIIPGYHMNKKHWNTVYIDQGLDDDFIIELIDHSYDLVVQSLPQKLKSTLTDDSI